MLGDRQPGLAVEEAEAGGDAPHLEVVDGVRPQPPDDAADDARRRAPARRCRGYVHPPRTGAGGASAAYAGQSGVDGRFGHSSSASPVACCPPWGRGSSAGRRMWPPPRVSFRLSGTAARIAGRRASSTAHSDRAGCRSASGCARRSRRNCRSRAGCWPATPLSTPSILPEIAVLAQHALHFRPRVVAPSSAATFAVVMPNSSAATRPKCTQRTRSAKPWSPWRTSGPSGSLLITSGRMV